MKLNRLTLTLVLFVQTISTYGQIGGHISSDQTWSGNIHVTEDAIIDLFVTVTVSAGTIIQFDAGCGLEVDGSLIANGSESVPIIFTTSNANPASGQWSGLNFTASDPLSSSSLEYCDIGYASTGISVNQSSDLLLNNLSIHDVATGVHVSGGDISLSNSEIVDVTVSRQSNSDKIA